MPITILFFVITQWALIFSEKCMLETIESSPNSPATASVIWLHGLGADGTDFLDIVPQLQLPKQPHVRFIFPHAPIRPVTMAGGAKLRAWFDIDNTGSANFDKDETGIRQSQKLVDELIANEIARKIPSNKIVLAGFSQGGAIALQCGLRYTQPLAGILALSCWLPLPQSLPREKSAANQSCPIMMMHGTNDTIVPIEGAESSYRLLQAQGFNIQWRTYQMLHSVCHQQIADIAQWLQKIST